VRKSAIYDEHQTPKLACAEQAHEFEEIATMDFPFEGIPTIPPRKDMDRMVSQFRGCPNIPLALPSRRIILDKIAEVYFVLLTTVRNKAMQIHHPRRHA